MPFDSFDQNVSNGIVSELQITNVAGCSTAVSVCLTGAVITMGAGRKR